MKKSDIINILDNISDDTNIIEILPSMKDNPRIVLESCVDDSLHELDLDDLTDAEFRHLIIKYMLGEDFIDNIEDQRKLNREAAIAILDHHSQQFHLNYENWKLRNKLECKQSNCDHDCSLQLKYDIMQKNYDLMAKENNKLNKLVTGIAEVLSDSGMYF